MNRRTLLGRFAAIVAAVTVAPVVSETPKVSATSLAKPPALKAEAAVDASTVTFTGGADTGLYFNGAEWRRAVLGADAGPLTFEAMQADCAALGCQLVPSPFSGPRDNRTITHIDHEGLWHGYDYSTDASEYILARVDAWRTGLHEQADPDRRAMRYDWSNRPRELTLHTDAEVTALPRVGAVRWSPRAT